MADFKGQVFTVRGADGVDHQWAIDLHGEDGLPIAMELAKVFVAPLGAALGGLFGVDDGVEKIVDLMATMKEAPTDEARGAAVADAMVDAEGGNVDLPRLIAAAAPAVQGAVDRLSPQLVRSLLAHASRDGKALSERANFSQAFAGNWTEMYAGCWQIVLRNRFLPLLGT